MTKSKFLFLHRFSKSSRPAILSLVLILSCLFSNSFAAPASNGKKNLAQYYSREEKTAYDRIMSKYVTSFLIVGFVIVFFILIVIFVGGVEGSLRTASNVFLASYVFLLINYFLWLFIHNNWILIVGGALTSTFFLFLPTAILKEKVEEKRNKQKDLRLQWICPQCNVTNQHSPKCWNCGRAKNAEA